MSPPPTNRDDAPTPEQPAGPFYPRSDQLDARPGALRDNDLTALPDHAEPARGDAVVIAGVVADIHNEPVVGILVEIWQACASGRYLSSRDRRRSRAHDPGFQYFGTCTTDAAGRYAFRTVMPPAYPSGVLPGWTRPRHVHFRLRLPDGDDFVTQLYFDDPSDPLNDEENVELQRRDLLLMAVSRACRSHLIRPVRRPATADPPPWHGFTAPRVVDFPIRLDDTYRLDDSLRAPGS